MDATWAQNRFFAARVARLATVDAAGQPHLVPIVFAGSGSTIYTAVDAKPKSTRALRRLRNMADNPRVSVLVDHYDDDWAQLWWARADALARILDDDIHESCEARAELARRYPQYRTEPPPGPVVALHVMRWSGWSALDSGPDASP
jgi:PPOX class probable F420-dependent enzyme